MKYVYKTLNNIQTCLITWGNPFDCDGSDVIVCITGNPGFPDFYNDFGTELHRSTSLPVCVVGQSGHAIVPDKESNVLKNKVHLLNLQGQLGHKLDLLCNHIDKKSKLHLIGHSIGAWLVVESLQTNEVIFNRVSSVNLLFPTLQRMAASKNGKYVNEFLRRINFFIILLLNFFHIMPESVRFFLVKMYLKFSSQPSQFSETILKYIHPKVMEKVLVLAYDEMDTVTTLNKEAIDKIKHLTNIIYGSNDGWAPLHYMHDLKIFQPSLQMIQVNIEHAFVFKSSERVAEMVVEFIKTKLV